MACLASAQTATNTYGAHQAPRYIGSFRDLKYAGTCSTGIPIAVNRAVLACSA